MATLRGSLFAISDSLLLRFRGSRLEIVTPVGTETVVEDRDQTLALNEAFVHALRTGDWGGVRVTYHDAVRTLAVVLAANRANETGRVIRVSELIP